LTTEKTKSDQLRSIFKTIIFAIALVFMIRAFLFSPYIVEGASMNPTLHNGERLFVNKLSYSLHDIHRGDIVIIKDEAKNKHYVKRVIGLPGEKIEMKKDQLYIDDKKVSEPYLKTNRQIANNMDMELTGDFEPVQIPENEVFVMGDNRLYSMDSRNGLGLIDEKRIVGKSEFVFYPVKKIRKTT
jgi:signal peptidase I